MLNSAKLVTAAVLVLAGCVRQASDDRTAEEMAKERLQQVPAAPERTVTRVSNPVQADTFPFEVYTWQPSRGPSGARQIVVLGENLGAASSLAIGDVVIRLTPAEDGRSAAGPYPSRVQRDLPILLTVGDINVELAERFSPLKLEGLPRILRCEYRWETVQAPERVPEVGGQTVRALRFQCAVSGMEPRNAPVTAFFGSVAVPNDQISEDSESVSGYVYRTDGLRTGLPVTIDFGHGLRVLAPGGLRLPS